MKKSLPLLIIILFLSACTPAYKVDVDLTPDQIKEIQSNIKASQEAIDNYHGEANTIPNLDIINLAEAYVSLGDLGKAIKIYQDVLDQGYKTKAILNNLGHLYDQVGEYDKAVSLYERLVNEYNDDEYLLESAWTYIRAKNRDKAQKYYDQWKTSTKKTNSQMEDAITSLQIS